MTEAETVVHKGFEVTVADAVGAGDAFTACLAHYYLRRFSLQDINESANRLAAWVATQKGATPSITGEKLQSILNRVAFR
jgi:fructokinase